MIPNSKISSAKKRPPVGLFLIPPSIPYKYLARALQGEPSPFAQSVVIPLGPLYLSSVLERDFPDCDIRIMDMARIYRNHFDSENLPKTNLFDMTIQGLSEYDFTPDFVGISVIFSSAHRSVKIVADAAKQRWPETPVIVGGNHATNATKLLFSYDSVDYVFRGEGEAVISDIAVAARDGVNLETVQGVISRKKLSQQPLMEAAPLIDDLDSIPFPAWHLLPMEEYALDLIPGRTSRFGNMNEVEADRQVAIMTTRGCPYSCTFCGSWTVHGRKMRFRSTENVLQELRILNQRYGIMTISPEDDLFTVKKDRVIELCNAIADEFGDKLRFQFPNGLSANTLDKDVIHALKKMGMEVVNIAIESGSEYVQRKIIKKNCNLEHAREVIQECRDTGVITRAFFILGLPGETLELMQETVDYAASLPTDWNTFQIAWPLVGTEMFEQFEERGEITGQSDENLFEEAGIRRFFDTGEITSDEPCLSGYHPHPLYVVCTHFPE